MKLKSETACPRNGIYPFTCSIPLGILYIVLFVLNKKQTHWQNFMTKFQEIHLLKFDRKKPFLYTFLYKRYYFISHLPINLKQSCRRLLQYIVVWRGHSYRFLANGKSKFSKEIPLEPSWERKVLQFNFYLYIIFKFWFWKSSCNPSFQGNLPIGMFYCCLLFCHHSWHCKVGKNAISFVVAWTKSKYEFYTRAQRWKKFYINA